MIKHFIKISLKSIQKNKLNTLITLVGLSLGLTCTIIIGLWVKYEFSYDKFHDHSQDLYKAAFTHEPSDFHGYVLPAPVAQHLKDEYADINNATVFWNWGIKKIIHGENRILVNGSFVDPSFFSMFNFPLKIGNISEAFSQPNSIVLTQTLAEKLFGDKSPIGNTVMVDGEDEYIVTAVLEDIPANSDIQFEFLLPYKLISKYFDSWSNKTMQVYVQLNNGANYSVVNTKIANILNQFNPDWNNRLYIKPLTDCHLYDLEGGGRIQYVYILTVVAFLILIIAIFNIVNLTMATSDKRIKEIGLRKILGSRKKLLIIQFLIEAQVLAMISMSFALVLVELLLPSVNNMLQINLILSYNQGTIFLLFGFAVMTGIISGTYPASYLSSLRPINLLRKAIHPFDASNIVTKYTIQNKLKLRSAILVFQFSLTIILIVGIIVIAKQVQFMKEKDLGFIKEDILIVKMQDELKSKFQAAKNELLMMPEISSISSSRSPLTVWWMSDMPEWEGKTTDVVFDMGLNFVDFDFEETVGIEVLEGRFLSPEFSTDASEGFVINEAAVKAMELKNPVGTRMTLFDGTTSEQKGEVIGVIRNMHTESLHSKIKPFAFRYSQSGSIMYIKLKRSINPSILQTIKSRIEKIAPNDPIELSYLEDELDKLYSKEQTTESLIGFSSIIAIIISCLGLFGLSLFGLQKRIKEIGIRKVNGALVSEILIMLNKDFLKWISVAFIIAVPIAWYVMNNWLQNFAYKIGLSWWIFALAGLVALLIVLVTISFQIIKVARRNPVEALRYE